MLLAIIAGYALTVLILQGLHRDIIFQPVSLPPDYQFDFEQPFSELFLPDDSLALRLHALHFPSRDSARGVLLYFHGNADNLQRWGRYTVDFTDRGYEVLAIDYPGYGKSAGRPSEKGFYRSAELAYAWARERFPADQIIIYGRSLGGGPASWLAARRPAQQLILETPFSSVPRLFRSRASVLLVPFEPHIKFPVIRYLKSTHYSITILHGTDDWVIPYRVAEQLRSSLKRTDHFITIEGGSHKDLRNFPKYQRALDGLLLAEQDQ